MTGGLAGAWLRVAAAASVTGCLLLLPEGANAGRPQTISAVRAAKSMGSGHESDGVWRPASGVRLEVPGVPARFYLRRAWERAGRQWLEEYSGLKWNDAGRRWEPDQGAAYRSEATAQLAYNLEYAARGAVEFGVTTRDMALLDELARFYLGYAIRFTTLGELRQRRSWRVWTHLLSDQGPDSARTLPWVEEGSLRTVVRECLLCNSQFFHPASRLIRVIAQIPEGDRTPAMSEFAKVYGPLIVRDHLLRLAFVTRWDYWGAEDLPGRLMAIWRKLAHGTARHRLSYQHAMRGIDLWLMGAAAEMLGATTSDPRLVPLEQDEVASLREIVSVGTELLGRKLTVRRETRNWRGEVVGSASYFDGDFDEHSDMAYARYEGESYPPRMMTYPARGGSWDISHFYKVPVVLRSLYDNRQATGVAVPRETDIELIVNQHVYRVFKGDLSRPLFRNFFDGQDGWYRVGYHGRDFGYPPSQYCDMGDRNRPCLTVAGVFGWGLLAFLHEDLAKIQEGLVRLAASSDPERVRFRDRYYRYNGVTFSFTDSGGSMQYPFLLFAILADASRLVTW